MPSPTCTSHLTHEKELRSVVLSHLLLPHPTAFLLNGGKCNGVEADFKGMGLSPESRKAERSVEEQDEFQREPTGEFLSAGIPAELVLHHGVQLGSVCSSGDAVSKPLPVASVCWAALNPGTRTLLSDSGPARPRGVPWELARGRLLRGWR